MDVKIREYLNCNNIDKLIWIFFMIIQDDKFWIGCGKNFGSDVLRIKMIVFKL